MRTWGIACASAAAALCFSAGALANSFSLRSAVQSALDNNPNIEAARQNHQATTFALRQAQGRRLPEIRLDGDVGRQLIDQPQGLSAENNNRWRTRREARLTMRQVLFDAWDRANDIYKNKARTDAAAFRLLERSERIALDVVEAYIDVRRHRKILSIARQNLNRHRRILSIVRDRRSGGRAAASETIQTEERIAAAQAISQQIQQSLLEAVAKFRRVVGSSPGSLRPIGYPGHLPRNRRAAIRIAEEHHPSLQVADADVESARFAVAQSRSANLPVVALEGNANYGRDIDGTPGRDEEYVGRLTLNWRIFDGRIGRNRTRELAARQAQAAAERDARRRQIIEAIDRALAGYQVGGSRVASLRKRTADSRRVIRAYEDEYKLSNRSLIDLLDAENAYFNSQFQLESVRAVHIFSGYQLAAGIGQLLEKLKVNAPEAASGNDGQRRWQGHGWGVTTVHVAPRAKR